MGFFDSEEAALCISTF